MKYILIIALLLTGCGGGGGNEPATSETVIQTEQPAIETAPLTSIWYGDSRCLWNKYLESKDCVGGRKLIHLEAINPDYDRIIIHLGYNDLWGRFDSELFGAHLEHLITGIEDKVWCVLPKWYEKYPTHYVDELRAQILRVCKHTVDPLIQPLTEDGVHYTNENYLQIQGLYESIMAE